MAAPAAKGTLAPVLGRRDYGTYGPRQATRSDPQAHIPKAQYLNSQSSAAKELG